MPERALALVVRATDWSETSRICTLFTREFGRVRGLAKGGRRLKSSFEMALELLSVSQIVFLRKAHGGLDLLTEARSDRRFPKLRTNLLALNAAYYIAELLSDGTQDYDPHPILFDGALAALGRLGSADSPASSALSVAATVSAFELVWLRELGYSLRLDACVACNRALPASNDASARVGFSPGAGGAVCRDCRAEFRDASDIADAARSALVALAVPDRPADGLLDAPSRRGVRSLLGQMVSSVLGRRPRLLGYVDGT